MVSSISMLNESFSDGDVVMIKLWFDDYKGPKYLGEFGDFKTTWMYMVWYLKNYGNLNHDPYYYNCYEYIDEESGKRSIHVDYGSYRRFFRLVGATFEMNKREMGYKND